MVSIVGNLTADTITLNEYVHEAVIPKDRNPIFFTPIPMCWTAPCAGRGRVRGTKNGGHVGWEPNMTAALYAVPSLWAQLVHKIRPADISAGQGTARGYTL
jgi:hypothetical protein